MCDPISTTNLKIKLGINTLGCLTFILSFIGFVLSVYVATMKDKYRVDNAMTKLENNATSIHIWNMNMNRSIIVLVAAILGVVLFFEMISSVLLLIGIKKNKPGFVLVYFGYGVMLTLLMFLSALLEVIQSYWAAGFSTIFLSAMFIRCLIFVHNVYEMMLKGLIFGTDGHSLIENEQNMY